MCTSLHRGEENVAFEEDVKELRDIPVPVRIVTGAEVHNVWNSLDLHL